MGLIILGGMERAVYYSKSFVIALAMVRQRLNAEQAAQAALVEVRSQIQRWGEVEDSKSRIFIHCTSTELSH